MCTSSASTSDRRALILGGGGSTGNAWLVGVLAGLFEAGLDVTTAHVTVGTSAGATAAAQLAGATPTELLAAVLARGSLVPRAPQDGAETSRKPVQDQLARTAAIIAASENVEVMRRALGAAALARLAGSDGSWQERWRTTVAARLPQQRWPERKVLLTAVEARTGAPVVFDRDSGVDLVDAVAASCSSGLPYRIGDGYYLDGGYRTNADNADLASRCGRVLVLSPFGGRTLLPQEWGLHLSAQIDALRAAGSQVGAIFPGRDSQHLFGVNAMDLSLRPAAARLGYDQAKGLVEPLTRLWC